MNVFPKKKKIFPSSTIRLLKGIWVQRSIKSECIKEIFQDETNFTVETRVINGINLCSENICKYVIHNR